MSQLLATAPSFSIHPEIVSQITKECSENGLALIRIFDHISRIFILKITYEMDGSKTLGKVAFASKNLVVLNVTHQQPLLESAQRILDLFIQYVNVFRSQLKPSTPLKEVFFSQQELNEFENQVGRDFDNVIGCIE